MFKVYEIWSMVNTKSGGMEAVGLAVFAEGQALITAEARFPFTLLVDYEFTSLDDATGRTLPMVESYRETPDAVRSFTEFYALAAEKYGWDPEEEKYWWEHGPESIYGVEHAGKRLKKPKGFVRPELDVDRT